MTEIEQLAPFLVGLVVGLMAMFLYANGHVNRLSNDNEQLSRQNDKLFTDSQRWKLAAKNASEASVEFETRLYVVQQKLKEHEDDGQQWN